MCTFPFCVLTFHSASSRLPPCFLVSIPALSLALEGVIVEVEVDYSNGLPAVIIVGLPDAAVQESRERVQTAVKNAGLNFPGHRVVVNLAPAAVRKEGPAYDLPIALGVMVLAGFLPQECMDGTVIVGELSLDGLVRHTAACCACGYYGDSLKPCTRAHPLVTKYQKRISGPLLDRIDTAKPHRSTAREL